MACRHLRKGGGPVWWDGGWKICFWVNGQFALRIPWPTSRSPLNQLVLNCRILIEPLHRGAEESQGYREPEHNHSYSQACAVKDQPNHAAIGRCLKREHQPNHSTRKCNQRKASAAN